MASAGSSEAGSGRRDDLDSEDLAREQEIERELSESIARNIDMLGSREPLGSALKSIAAEAFRRGVGRDALVERLMQPDVFSVKGKIGEGLNLCILAEIEQFYRTVNYTRRAQDKFPKALKHRAEVALDKFLAELGTDKSITDFFRDLLEGKLGSVPVLFRPNDTNAGVSKSSLETWATSDRLIVRICERMQKLVRPEIRKHYRTFISHNPTGYIASFATDAVKLNAATGDAIGIAINDDAIGNLIADVCLSIDFKEFFDAVLESMDGQMRSLKGKVSDRQKMWLLEYVEAFYKPKWEAVWERIRKKEERIEEHPERVEAMSANEVRSLQQSTTRQIHATVHLPGTERDQSGSHRKFRVEVVCTNGGKTTTVEFWAKANVVHMPDNALRRYIRNKLHEFGIEVRIGSPEVDEIIARLAGRVSAIEPSKRRPSRKMRQFPQGRRI